MNGDDEKLSGDNDRIPGSDIVLNIVFVEFVLENVLKVEFVLDFVDVLIVLENGLKFVDDVLVIEVEVELLEGVIATEGVLFSAPVLLTFLALCDEARGNEAARNEGTQLGEHKGDIIW